MEPAQGEVERPNRLVYYTTIMSVQQEKCLVRSWKVGDEVMTQYEELGWFIHMNGSWEKLHAGFTQPDFKAGDKVRVIVERVIDAKS